MNRDAWLQAIREAGITVVATDPNAVTMDEFAELLGVKRAQANRRMLELLAMGKAREVRRYVPRRGGGEYPIPAYVLVESTNGENEPGSGRRGNARRRGRTGSRPGTRR